MASKNSPPAKEQTTLNIPPHSIEAEQAVLGSILLNDKCWDDVAENVVKEDFYRFEHRLIFEEMEKLMAQQAPVDLITLEQALKNREVIEQVGGFAYLAELSNNTPSAANVGAYANVVREKAIMRELISVGNKIAQNSYSPKGQDVKQLLDEAEREVFAIAEKRTPSNEGLASLSRVDQTKIRTGQGLDDNDWAKISSTMGMLAKKPNLFIDDSSGLTPTELRSRARRVYRENGGLSLIMVDYLQLMRAPAFSDNRTLEIAEISRSLKALAKELEVPVIALSQLNRTLENRQDKRPVNSDLRESGSIEQDADLIMFIYRDEVYNRESEEKGIAEIIIGKQRNGPIGRVKLAFQGNFSRFDNLAEHHYYDDEY